MANCIVGNFVGGLKKASTNRKLANACVRLAPKEPQMRRIPCADLPLYSNDRDQKVPP